MATFYRRLQTNSVIRGVQISLVDLAITALFSGCSWIGTAKLLELYEIDCTGIILAPFVVALFVFIKVCEWFRKEGDGVIKKDGRFRYLSSHKINRIIIPDANNAIELFVVVRDVFHTSTSTQRLTGTNFCRNLKRSKQ